MTARVGSLLSLGCALLLGTTSTAIAQDDEVVKRLTRHGDLGKAQAARLVKQIDKRMKRSADMTQGRNDPLRAEVNKAVLGTPVAPDTMAAAKVRLRLYAGLNEWALEKLFAPRQGALAGCAQVFGASQKECEALVAAAGKISLADARKRGAGAAQTAAAGGRGGSGSRPAAAPRWGTQPRRFGTPPPSRFGGGNGYQRPNKAYGVRRAPAAGQRPASGVQRAAPRAAPRAATARVNTKEEYKRRRQAYLERQRKRMEERKAKLRAASGPSKVERGPTSEEEAKVVGIAPSKAKSAPEPAKDSPGSDKPAAQEAGPAAGIDEGFLDGLLDDPLGKK